jgi:hypothetical protein
MAGKLLTRLATEAEEEDGEGDGDKAKVNDECIGPGDQLNGAGGFFGAQAKGLEDGGNAVAEVRAEAGHGDEVKDDNEGTLEADDDHFPRALFSEVCEFAIDANGEVENMEDDEGENGQAAPDHEAGGFGSLHRGVVSVFRTGCFILFCQENSEPNVNDEADEESDTGDPNAHPVEEGVEEMGILVEGFFTGENEEVAGKVAGEEQDEGQAGEGNDDFTTDGGLKKGAQGAGRGTHGSRGHPAGAESRICLKPKKTSGERVI